MNGSSDLLINIIQLTVMGVAMGAAIKYTQNSNQAVKALSNGSQSLFKKFGGEKLTEAGRKGLGNRIKRGALNTEAKMMGMEGDTRRARVLRGASRFRHVRKSSRDNQERERSRAVEEAVARSYEGDGTVAGERTAERLRLRAAGVGGEKGAARVEASVGSVATKREQEEIQAAQSAMRRHENYARDSIGVAVEAFEKAVEAGDEAGIRAAMAELATSAPGVDTLHGLIAANEGNLATRHAMQKGVNDNWTPLKTRDASITKWSGDDAAQIDTVAASPAPYSTLTAEQLSTQTPDAAKRAVASVGGAPPAITPEMAAAILASPAQANLNSETRTVYENHARSGRPADPMSGAPVGARRTPEDTGVVHGPETGP